MSSDHNQIRVCFVSSYPPRECGIASFTADLAQALTTCPSIRDFVVVAINEAGGLHPYGEEVIYRIDQGGPETYVEAAQLLNERDDIDVVSVQHEFGRFGVWEDYLRADYLRPFLETLQKPVVVTLHTVLPSPHPTVHEAITSAAQHSRALVVMARIGAFMLADEYGIPAEKIVYIPHGIPEIVPAGRRKLKAQLGIPDRTVISTFGLISPGKGIEYVIRALPEIVQKYPEVLYLVVGQTHPDLRRTAGESYRNWLQELIQKLGVSDHVAFVDQYLSRDEIIDYLLATDIYVTPYIQRNQITSGTLSYALGAGKAIVSTPYIHATEALAEHRGIFAELRSAESIARAILFILDNPDEKERLEKRAYDYGRRMSWPHVAKDFAHLLQLAIENRPVASPSGDPFRLNEEGVNHGEGKGR